jgi:hypothetical protein
MKEKKHQSSAVGNKTVVLLLPGQSSVGSNSDHDNIPENNDSLEEYHNAEQEELPSCSNNKDCSRALSYQGMVPSAVASSAYSLW